ncbi:MAG: hypothetical protein KatS3mg064_0543 [Tepidiforma sp.]|nr:MAG: hypothetical protein KatS3mg064_0543 [Tepidiforma sp.]
MHPLKRLAGAAVVAALLAGSTFAADTAFAQSPPEPPSRFAGSVTIDGQPAPAGTPIEARVGNASCGVATVFLQGGQARYVIDVAGAATQAGCGTPGAQVTFVVGGRAAPQTGSWRNYELVQLDLALTSATPTPAATQPPAATPTPRPPVAGTSRAHADAPSAWWIVAMAGLASLGFAGMGWAASRRQ